MPPDAQFIYLSGALLIGLLHGLVEHGAPISPDARHALGAGFLVGGYTTFSTLSFKTATLARRGELRKAWLTIGVSLIGGLVAAS